MGCRKNGNNNRIVLQYDLNGNFVARYGRLIDAASSIGLNKTTIWQCCQNRTRYTQAGGFIWIYEEDIGAINERVNAIRQYSVENLQGEEWRDVVGYEGLYQVSNLGRIKSLYAHNKWGHKRESILSPGIDKFGYSRYCLNKKGIGKTEKLHRLVAKAFLPNPENKPLIDHIDGNPSNNCVENLRWATYKENLHNPNTKKKCKAVLQFSLDGKFIKTWDSAYEAAKSVNKSDSAIRASCNNIKPTAGGYIWKYTNTQS